MKNWVFFLFLVANTSLFAQVPTACFEIESILVDACGTPEYDNELVRFKVGPNDLNAAALNVNWPNNFFLGICQNATTASAVAALNATLLPCAYILEPTGGILPAGSTVYLVCGTDMDPAANPLVNLVDTVYMIFQCPGNNAGHFKNYQAGSGPRTLQMDFGGACSDVVTYIVDSLVTMAGVPGAQDGAYVDFNWSGQDSYHNDGCAIPVSFPVATIFSDLPTACMGDSLHLHVTVTSDEPTAIVWSANCGNFTTTTDDTTAFYISTLGGSSFVSVTVTLLCSGVQVTDTFFIPPTTLPVAAVSPAGSSVVCPGNTISFSASGGSTYWWSTGAMGANLTLGTPGNYFLIAFDNCALDTTTFSITQPPPPAAQIAASWPVICPGATIDLVASGSGSFIWSTGETTDTITVSTAGIVGLTADNGCTTATDNLNIINGVLPNATITPSNPAAVCAGDSVLLTCGFTAGQILWLPSGDTLSATQYSLAGTTVQFINTNFCGSDTAEVSIPVEPPVLASALASVGSICPGDSSLLTGSGGTGGYWIGLPLQNPVYVDAAGTYQYVATGVCLNDTATVTISMSTVPTIDFQLSANETICAGSSLLISPLGSSVPVWQDGTFAATYTVTQAGLYYATVTASCGVVSDSVLVTVINPPVTVVSPNPVQYCPGNSNAVTASGADSYEWSDGSTLSGWTVPSTGNFWVAGSNLCGTDTAFFNAVPGNGPTGTITPSGIVEICPGETIALNASGSATIVWQDGTTGSAFNATSAGTYTAIVSDACGSDTVSVTLIPGTLPDAAITYSSLTFCEGESVVFTSQGDPNVNYYWSNGQTSTSITINEGGQYTLTAFNSCGSVSSSVFASIETVDANAQATSTVLFPGQSVGVFLQGDNINQVQWTLPDGSQSDDYELSMQLDTLGVYTFSAVVTSPSGCTTTTSIQVEVREGFSFFVPAAFTPDGNGINERFNGYGTGIDTYKMTIFDRWGEVLFISEELGNGWDGYDKGRPCPNGQYAYEFLIRSTEGVEKSYYGFVVLIR